MSWLIENKELVALIAAVIVAILRELGRAKLARIIEVIVGAVEKHDSIDLKADIEGRALDAGLEPRLSRFVTRVTKTNGRP